MSAEASTRAATHRSWPPLPPGRRKVPGSLVSHHNAYNDAFTDLVFSKPQGGTAYYATAAQIRKATSWGARSPGARSSTREPPCPPSSRRSSLAWASP
jgi:hypothetical protein